MTGVATGFVTTKTSASAAPTKAKANTPPERLERVRLYHDREVREAFVLRKTTVEPFRGRLKALFELEYLCMKGPRNIRLGRDVLKLQDTLIAIR